MSQPSTSADRLVRWRYRTAVQAALVLNRMTTAPTGVRTFDRPATGAGPWDRPPDGETVET